VSAADPRVVWEALQARGYEPRGTVESFRSRCPGHDGTSADALSVKAMPSGVVALHCHAHNCPADEIVERLGLRMADLFPSDRRYSARLRNAHRDDFTEPYRLAANVLVAVQRLGVSCRVTLGLDECPCCESPHVVLVVGAGKPFVHCPRGCGVEAITGALADAVRRSR
jgi:hypothetical protein